MKIQARDLLYRGVVGSGFDVVDVRGGVNDGAEQPLIVVMNDACKYRGRCHFQTVVADVPDDVQLSSVKPT